MTIPANPKAIRSQLCRIGKTPVDLARELGVSPSTVRAVIAGHLKGDRGDAHKVAVALGLKEGVIIVEGMPIAEAIRKAAA